MPKALKAIIITILIILVTYIGTVKIFNVPEKIMKKIYPKTYSEYVTDYSKEYDVDPLLVYAVIKAESNFNANAESGKGAIGLMQLMESTAQKRGDTLMPPPE